MSHTVPSCVTHSLSSNLFRLFPLTIERELASTKPNLLDIADQGSAVSTIRNGNITLASDPDLTISVASIVRSTKGGQRRRFVTRFKVSSDILRVNSEYFTASLRFRDTHGPNPGANTIELGDDNINAMHLWLARMHTNDEKDLWRSGEIYETAGLNRVWHAICLADKYSFDAELLRNFFVKWYSKNVEISSLDENDAPALALPCFFFDHTEAFAEVTKWLAYNHVGHIKEKRPFGFRWKHQHLSPPDFVGPMNHARGGLKSSVHRGIWSDIGDLLKRRHCECGGWKSTAGSYFAELVRTDAYPLEDTYGKSSTNEILARLENFNMTFPRLACSSCDIDWNGVVESAVRITEGYFNGLCIDCMDRSRPKRDNTDDDYWQHNIPVNGRWDTNCRIKHGEPTWYVSWCGRDELRHKLMQERKDQKRSISWADS